MKAVAVFPRTKEIGLVDHAPPSLQHPTDVRIRILDVGVCGTGQEIGAFDHGTRWPDAVGRLITGRFKLEGRLKLLACNRMGIKKVVSFAS